MKDFKVISEAEDSYHLKHKNGKAFTVDKKGLSPKAKEAIQKFCMGGSPKGYYEGKTVTPAPVQTPTPIPDQDPSATVIPTPEPAPSQMGGATGSWTEDPAPPSPAPQAVRPVDPLVQGKLSTEGVLGKEAEDVQRYQNELGNAAKTQQGAYQDFINQQAQMKTPQQISDEYKSKDDALMQAFMDKKIDPDQYIHNMSTSSKVLSGIGLVLGGLAGGIGGHPGQNVALDSLNRSINNDIDAQKNAQGSAMNLWKMNREHMKDDQSATLATQNQMLSGLQAKISMAGANVANSDARLRAAQMVSQIEQQKIANRQRLGLLTQGAGGSVSQADPVSLVPELVPAEHQKQALTEIGQSQAAVKSEDSLLKLFDQAAEQNRPTTGRSATSIMNSIPGYETPASRGLRALSDPLIHDNEGRINQQEQEDLRGIWPKWGDSDETVAANKQSFQDFINHKKSAPTAKAFGIDMNNFSSTSNDPVARLSPQKKAFYDFAKANPSDPGSATMLKKLGVQ